MKCVVRVMEVLNELEVERIGRFNSEMVGGASPGEQSTAQPTAEGLETAWMILRDVKQHEDTEALANLVANIGIIDSRYLRVCKGPASRVGAY
jgi:hypothetical protein